MRRLLALVFGLVLSAQVLALSLADLSNEQAGSGLKEALSRGAETAVSQLGQQDGFLGNPQVKIPLPDSMHKAEKRLREFGMGGPADQLIATMNHAAESAVVLAEPILIDAVKHMSFDDAKGILTGGDDAATQYFRRTTSDAIAAKFLPVVQGITAKDGLAQRYDEFAGPAADFGLIDKQDADLNTYITQKALDGLFLMIAQQEKSIRANPVAAGSKLLSQVFGAIGH